MRRREHAIALQGTMESRALRIVQAILLAMEEGLALSKKGAVSAMKHLQEQIATSENVPLARMVARA
jgi:hypothetical protein